MIAKDWMNIMIGKNGEGPKNDQEKLQMTGKSQENY